MSLDYMTHRGDAPGVGAVAVTKHDTNPLPSPVRRLIVFAAGTVRFKCRDGTEDTYTVPAGALPYSIDMDIVQVFSTGTSVANADLKGVR